MNTEKVRADLGNLINEVAAECAGEVLSDLTDRQSRALELYYAGVRGSDLLSAMHNAVGVGAMDAEICSHLFVGRN